MKLLFLGTTKFSSNWTKAKFIENAEENICDTQHHICADYVLCQHRGE